ncbi:MAG: DUF3817 domain-containing protein [Planctomycetota bacterium]
MQNPVPRLRAITMAEGVSYVVLVAVAMPLKWVWGHPAYVTVFGWIHGVLFAWFAWALMRVYQSAQWPIARLVGVLLAGLVPFVPFFMHARFDAWTAEWQPLPLE